MTAVRWTEPANADFLGVIEWLKARNPSAAARVGRRILDSVELLVEQPYLGKRFDCVDRKSAIVQLPGDWCNDDRDSFRGGHRV
jgi:plasmid stabilization system protein ParE